MPFDPSKIRARLTPEKKWYSINNLAGGEADVMLYGEIGWLGTNAEDFVSDLKQLQASQINLHLSSPGGSVFDGIAIMNALRAHPANVTVYVDSIAASIASVIAMAGDRIIARQASEFMIHEAAGLAIGNAAEMRDMAELLDRQSDKIAGIYAARAGGTVEDWRAAMAKETWYSAQEAVDAGLADEVDDAPRKGAPMSEEMAAAASWDLSVFRYAGREKAPAPEPAAKAVEAPKPAPPTSTAEPLTLTFNVGAELGDQVVEMLRQSVARRGEPAAVMPEVTDTAVPVHHTATEDRPWDKGPNEKRLPSPMTVATAKAMYGWYDEAQVEDGELPKSACSLPHHEVSADGKPGAANLSGVRNALARLPQADIPASQHDAVRRHLQAHLDDAKQSDDTTDIEPTAAAEEPPAETEPDDWTAAIASLVEPAPDSWAATVAHLTQDDAWSALVSNLTEPTKSSSATAA